MKSFLTKSLSLAALLILAGFLAIQFLPTELPFLFILLIVTFLFSLTNILHYRLLKTAEKNMRKFIPTFMGLNMLKMFIYLLAAVALILTFRQWAKEILASFLVGYLGFSLLEVIEISRILRQKK